MTRTRPYPVLILHYLAVVATLATVAILTQSCNCGGDSRLDQLCPEVCYTGPDHTAGIGVCRTGVPTCNEAHQIITCLGEVTPRPRYCTDIEDISCDNFKSAPLDTGIGTGCGSNVGACHIGHVECINHALTCTGAQGPRTEDCSGHDLDCDGIANDVTPKVCYDGTPADLIIPNTQCRAGIETCPVGVCQGEVLPGAIPKVDIVILMIRDEDVLQEGILVGDNYKFSEWLIGLAEAGRQTHTANDSSFMFGFATIDALTSGPLAISTIPLTDGDSFATQVLQLGPGTFPEEDVNTNIYDIATNAFNWPFRQDAHRVILLFADDNDEDDETSQLPGAHTSTQTMQSLRDNHIALYSMTPPSNSPDYSWWAVSSGGAVYPSPQTRDELLNDILGILGRLNGCTP